MGNKVLIVEDEPKLAALLKDYLRAAAFEPSWLSNGSDVAPWVREHSPDLLLLDLMLPGKDGLEICREVRAFSNVPIIMVTARIEEVDRLLGLELGADDYVCKPFSPREVVSRVKAVLRRACGGPPPSIKGLQLDEASYRARLDGHDLELTAVEFKLLQLLASHPGRIYAREQLMDRIYSDQRIVADRTIDSHVKKLRRKIEAVAPGRDLIQSVYGVGYRFETDRD